MQQNDTQPQFDDVDEFAHVFDSTLPEDEWKIRLPRELGLEARERARMMHHAYRIDPQGTLVRRFRWLFRRGRHRAHAKEQRRAQTAW